MHVVKVQIAVAELGRLLVPLLFHHLDVVTAEAKRVAILCERGVWACGVRLGQQAKDRATMRIVAG